MALNRLALFGVALLTVAPASAQAATTFTKEIAPIIYSRCAQCHRPGGAAPFSLLTYADAGRRRRRSRASRKRG
jgi:mono/diheme cytochrome c family protein